MGGCGAAPARMALAWHACCSHARGGARRRAAAALPAVHGSHAPSPPPSPLPCVACRATSTERLAPGPSSELLQRQRRRAVEAGRRRAAGGRRRALPGRRVSPPPFPPAIAATTVPQPAPAPRSVTCSGAGQLALAARAPPRLAASPSRAWNRGGAAGLNMASPAQARRAPEPLPSELNAAASTPFLEARAGGGAAAGGAGCRRACRRAFAARRPPLATAAARPAAAPHHCCSAPPALRRWARTS